MTLWHEARLAIAYLAVTVVHHINTRLLDIFEQLRLY